MENSVEKKKVKETVKYVTNLLNQDIKNYSDLSKSLVLFYFTEFRVDLIQQCLHELNNVIMNPKSSDFTNSFIALAFVEQQLNAATSMSKQASEQLKKLLEIISQKMIIYWR